MVILGEAAARTTRHERTSERAESEIILGRARGERIPGLCACTSRARSCA